MKPRIPITILTTFFVATLIFISHTVFATAPISDSWNNHLPSGETGTIRRIELGNYNVRYAVLTVHSDTTGFLSRISFSFSNYQAFNPSIRVHICAYDSSVVGSPTTFAGCGQVIGSSDSIPYIRVAVGVIRFGIRRNYI